MRRLSKKQFDLITMFILEHGEGQSDHLVWQESDTFDYWASDKELVKEHLWGVLIGHENNTSAKIIVYTAVLEQYKKQVDENG